MRTRMLAVLLALVATLSAAASAHAASVILFPATATSLNSLGTPVISTASGGIRCFIDLSVALNTLATGTLTALPDPSVNPLVGTVTGGSATSCGATVVLLFGTPWRYHVREVLPPLSNGGAIGYLDDVQILFAHGSGWSCLYRLRLLTQQLVPNGLLDVTGVQTLGATVLSGSCPAMTSFTGSFAFDVTHGFALLP